MHSQLLPRVFTAILIAVLFCQSGQIGYPARHGVNKSQNTETPAEVAELRRLFERGEYAEVIQRGQALLKDVPAPQARLRIRIMSAVGAAQVVAGHYRDALHSLIPARDLAREQSDIQDLVPICNSISWVYLKMDNLTAAGEYADQALSAQKASGKYEVRLILSRALIFAKKRDFRQSGALFFEAINYSLDKGDLVSASSAWYLQGRGYVAAGRNTEAEAALTESFRLRKIHHLRDLEVSMRDLAEVLANRGDLKTSAVLLNQAIAAIGTSKTTADTWGFLLDRGRLRLMGGDLPNALIDLRNALALARRLDVIPTDDDRVTFESGLAELYTLFIDCGNRLYLRNHNAALKEEIFEAAEENRAASLRALVPQPGGWRTRLPTEHGVVLKGLQDAERILLVSPGTAAQMKVRQLRASLDQIESRAQTGERTGPTSALKSVKKALTAQTAVLAFHLGPNTSWLWLITRETFAVYALPPKSEVAAHSAQFVSTLRKGKPAIELGDRLGRELLGALPAEAHAKTRWIVALDQELFDLPLSALRWRGHYLLEDHALLVTPGLHLLKPVQAQPTFAGKMLAVGDPIYNRADPRWQSHLGGKTLDLSSKKPADHWHFARLTGSGDEARSAVQTWGDGVALTGASGIRENILRMSRSQPTIIHLATHVIRAAGDDRAGMIVLGLNSLGEPEFLDMRNIIQLSLNAKLVVMSGCASGDARALPAAGLMGLTRAWLGSGVEDVLATRWPSVDENGAFFSSFYGNLRRDPTGGAAEALRKTAIEMLHSHSFRANPEYWASYFLIGTV